MFQPRPEAFEVAQPMLADDVSHALTQPLLLGASTISVAQALVCEAFRVELQGLPSPEETGAALLASTNFCEIRNYHLQAPRVRFLDVPEDQATTAKRLRWMWHAGTSLADPVARGRALEAVDLMTHQLAPDGEFDFDDLADELVSLSQDYPDIVAALFRGDLDDVPDLIDEAVQPGPDQQQLARLAAWMFVCWAGLEAQREACLGWRQKHVPLDGIWGQSGTKPWTIGQIFRARLEQHTFAHEMKNLYQGNLATGNETISDKRTINSIERKLRKTGFGWINRTSEQEIIAHFGRGRLASLPHILARHAAEADCHNREYVSLLKGSDGRSRAGKHADALSARISCVGRTAIVTARTWHLASMAIASEWSEDLRDMLDAGLPEVLRPLPNRRKSWEKFRLRQLFHVFRAEFLRDGEHLPKATKKLSCQGLIVPALDLDDSDVQRGHEIFDDCWAELHKQPSDWRFMSPFGWQCDRQPRLKLSACSVRKSFDAEETATFDEG